MATLSAAQAELFEEANCAVLTTLRADGSAHNTVIWVDYDGGAVSFSTLVGRAKEQHLARDPRATITIVKEPFKWISISGRVTLSSEGAEEQLDRLAQKYIDEAVYPWRAEGDVRVSVTLEIDMIDAYGIADKE